ncbi:MAG: M20/M25/M40 family metallo-hydrolase [Litorilinea sp.]
MEAPQGQHNITMHELKAYPARLAAVAAWASGEEALVQRAVEIQQIPAPTGDERARGENVAARFRELGLLDVDMDALFNVYGRVPARAGADRRDSRPEGRALMVSAHTDTVFGLDVDLAVQIDAAAGQIHGPGIGDNSAGVAALLGLAETLMQTPTAEGPAVDIWLVANSGEEGLGDLRGMRAAVDRLASQIGACIVIEGMGLGRIVHRALGSRRFRIEVNAPGGHSWSDFGTASAIHTLMHLGQEISRLTVPHAPRTTFNLGRISGGTSINTIAQHAMAELDMRSEATDALQMLVRQVEEIVDRYRVPLWQRRGVTVQVETIGDRPPGEIAADHPLVDAAVRTLLQACPTRVPDLRISSTDANIPLSRGIPAVCIGVTDGGDAHRRQEWIETAPLPQGMQHLLLLTWWASEWLGG